MDYLLQSIGNYGFPIIVASYLLIRMEKRLQNLDENVRNLTRAIENQRRK